MRFIILLVTMLFAVFSFAQTGLKGSIKSTSGEELPFSTIYIKGTTNGTTSNGSADYFLRTPAGRHTIVVQHVGYTVEEREVVLSENQVININFVLAEQALQLKTVTIVAGDEDPAHRVIREAIKKRKFYENEVKAFKTDAYLKGLQRLDKRPDKILGMKITIDTGIVYLSESVSEFSFERPDKVNEKMISSKVSGNEQGFSFNQASDFNINIYEKNFDLDISEREFVSPISSQAFVFYDFEWLGAFQENGKLINKIKLLPKRDSDPVFDGVVYIIEDSWKFHSVDLLVVKSRGIDFADSLKINQVFAPVVNDIWMPISQKFSFQFGAFGFKGSGYFIGVYSNYEVEPNYELYKEEGLFEETFEEQEATLDLFQKEDFTAEVLLVEEGSNERDSMYWQNIRPMPLTEIEVQDYVVKDSIRLVKESKPYKDSIDNVTNKISVGNILMSGYTHSNTDKERYWALPSIQSTIQFNTVEGVVSEFQPTIWFQNDRRTKYWIRPSLRYGFSSETFYSKFEASYRMLDDRFTRFYLAGGKYVSQFNEAEAISPFINSYTTLLNGQNYMKLFEKSFGYARFQQELKNGLLLNARLEYAVRDTLSNTKTDYYWAATKDVEFTSNQPYNEELNGGTDGQIGTGFARTKALTASVNFRIRFNQKYATRPDRKFIYSSKYPELHITYKRGFADVNYDFVSLRVEDDISLGLTGRSTYSFETGSFLSSKDLTFVDFKHFAGNQTNLSQVDKRYKFELLPFYMFSTGGTYLEGHFEHHFNEFIFNKLPLVRKLDLQAVASANYLTTKTIGNYFELGAGIEHIFKFMRVDYWWAVRNGSSFANGFRIGVGF